MTTQTQRLEPEEAIGALCQLGFKRRESEALIAETLPHVADDASTEDVLRAALWIAKHPGQRLPGEDSNDGVPDPAADGVSDSRAADHRDHSGANRVGSDTYQEALDRVREAHRRERNERERQRDDPADDYDTTGGRQDLPPHARHVKGAWRTLPNLRRAHGEASMGWNEGSNQSHDAEDGTTPITLTLPRYLVILQAALCGFGIAAALLVGLVATALAIPIVVWPLLSIGPLAPWAAAGDWLYRHGALSGPLLACTAVAFAVSPWRRRVLPYVRSGVFFGALLTVGLGIVWVGSALGWVIVRGMMR